jgi:hypothetical protein
MQILLIIRICATFAANFFMQKNLMLEREGLHRLPAVLSELTEEPVSRLDLRLPLSGQGVEVDAHVHGRRWIFEFKSSARPGVVAQAGERLAAFADREALGVLVVPYMTHAGARAAAERGVNWIDLAGNARLRHGDLFISVRGRPNPFVTRGRPSSPFAPKSARVARAMLIDPERWWRQKDLAITTDLDNSQVSRIVRRLDADELLERELRRFRPRDPSLLLDAWNDDYRFDRHDVVLGHLSGAGIELARTLDDRLSEAGIGHAFTGLSAAWLIDPFAEFRLNSVYVEGDPRDAADAVGARRNERGANVQFVGPDDDGVFAGLHDVDEMPCVSAVQVYLDLQHLPERARDAAEHLRERGLWNARGT